MHFDVFNGDADGIIALLQLRLAKPKKSTLITGVKRDISLVKQVPVANAKSVTVLDVSMEKNSEALKQLITADVKVFYVDHHRTGTVPVSDKLTSILDTDANTCTSLLVNHYLGGKYAHWAVAAAFGDNMAQSAQELADELNLSSQQQEQLKALGIYINYNGYGRSVDDLHFTPQALFTLLLKFPDPLMLIEDKSSVFYQLEQAYLDDMSKAKAADIIADNQHCQVVKLPDQAWARRVSGVYGNELANQAPDKAHAVLTSNQDGSFTVSLRAPLNNKQGADEICSQFPTGGGRAGAAGVNQLPAKMITQFVETVSKYYQF
jgi:hypothetical protein